jgi:hypothetical protein
MAVQPIKAWSDPDRHYIKMFVKHHVIKGSGDIQISQLVVVNPRLLGCSSSVVRTRSPYTRLSSVSAL